jgi:hypothetical protein
MTLETPAQESAMTEIALALAMGFFSIMVLTIISMGSGAAPVGQKLQKIVLIEPVDRADQAHESESSPSLGNQKIIIFDGEHFLNTDLQPINIESINSPGGNKDILTVLAMPPEISIKSAMEAKKRLTVNNVVVSYLDDAWMDALRSRK